jgi:hypothetical protein
MPIPPGARQVPGNPNRVRLADGSIVTRARARTLGAQLEGFRNENQRRHSPDRRDANDKYFKAWAKTPAGKRAITQAKAQAKAEGRAYRPGELKTELIAARNDRPHPGGRNPSGGRLWQEFGQKYGLFGYRDYVRY